MTITQRPVSTITRMLWPDGLDVFLGNRISAGIHRVAIIPECRTICNAGLTGVLLPCWLRSLDAFTFVATGLILTFEAGTYLHDYFTRYAERSQYAFANYGLTEALQRTVKWNPASIKDYSKL